MSTTAFPSVIEELSALGRLGHELADLRRKQAEGFASALVKRFGVSNANPVVHLELRRTASSADASDIWLRICCDSEQTAPLRVHTVSIGFSGITAIHGCLAVSPRKVAICDPERPSASPVESSTTASVKLNEIVSCEEAAWFQRELLSLGADLLAVVPAPMPLR